MKKNYEYKPNYNKYNVEGEPITNWQGVIICAAVTAFWIVYALVVLK